MLQELVDLTADAQAIPRRQVPRLRVHGLPDQLAVLTRDALAGLDDAGRARVGDLLTGLRRTL